MTKWQLNYVMWGTSMKSIMVLMDGMMIEDKDGKKTLPVSDSPLSELGMDMF